MKGYSMKPHEQSGGIDPILTIAQVVAIVTYSRSQLYKMIKSDRFVRPIKLGPARIGFRESAIAEWLRNRELQSGPD